MIELAVDDKALVGRILKRAEEAKAAGEPFARTTRAEVFDERLREYYKKTAPLIGYYYAKGMLKASTAWPTSTRLPNRSKRYSKGRKEKQERTVDGVASLDYSDASPNQA